MGGCGRRACCVRLVAGRLGAGGPLRRLPDVGGGGGLL